MNDNRSTAFHNAFVNFRVANVSHCVGFSRGHLRTLEERIRDAMENKNAETDQFLNERAAQYNPNGSIRRDHFRGLTKDAHMANNKTLDAQLALQNKIKEDEVYTIAVTTSINALSNIVKGQRRRVHDD